MTFNGFVFSEDTSALSDEEYRAACSLLDAVEACIINRTRLVTNDPGRAKFIMPDDGWHPESQPSFELDGSTKNAQTSYHLLASKDRDVIRKLRLYGHAFTGYQLATLEYAKKRPWVSRKLPDNWDETLAYLAGPPDQSVFDYVRVSSALPNELRITPPQKFGEIGWIWDKKIINDDTYAYLERFCLMEENGLMSYLSKRLTEKEMLTIVEIGGGYGALGYFLSNLFEGKLHYTIIDIPESLAFSSIYLSVLFPNIEAHFIESELKIWPPKNPGFRFLPNMYSQAFSQGGAQVDLVINTLSLSEMSDRQIHDYCQQISTMIGDTGIFFEQNHQSNHQGPGGIPPEYLKNLKRCSTQILPNSFPNHRGDANLWVNASYRG